MFSHNWHWEVLFLSYSGCSTHKSANKQCSMANCWTFCLRNWLTRVSDWAQSFTTRLELIGHWAFTTHTLTFACYYYNYCCHCRSISVTFFLPQQATKGLAVNGSGQMLVLLRYYIQHMTHIQKQMLCYAYRSMAKTASKMWEKSPSSPRATRRVVHKRFPAQSFNLTENKKRRKRRRQKSILAGRCAPVSCHKKRRSSVAIIDFQNSTAQHEHLPPFTSLVFSTSQFAY